MRQRWNTAPRGRPIVPGGCKARLFPASPRRLPTLQPRSLQPRRTRRPGPAQAQGAQAPSDLGLANWAWPRGLAQRSGPENWPRELAKGSSQEIWMIDLDDLGVWPSNRFLSAPPRNGALRRWLHSVRGTRLLTVPIGRRIRRTARLVPSRGGALLSHPTANKTPQLRADQHLSVTRDGAPANEDAWRNAQWRS